MSMSLEACCKVIRGLFPIGHEALDGPEECIQFDTAVFDTGVDAGVQQSS